jgi:hypothetical protein
MTTKKSIILIIISGIFILILEYKNYNEKFIINKLIYFNEYQMEEFHSLSNLGHYGNKDNSLYSKFNILYLEKPLVIRRCSFLAELIPGLKRYWLREGFLMISDENSSFFAINIPRDLIISRYSLTYFHDRENMFSHLYKFNKCYKTSEKFDFDKYKSQIQTSGQDFDFKEYLIKNSTYIDQRTSVRSVYFFMIVITFSLNFYIAKLLTKGDNVLAVVISVAFSIPQIFFLSSILFSYI